LFEFLSTIKEKRLQFKFIKKLSESDKFNQAFREIVFNICKQKIKLTPRQQKILKPFYRQLNELVQANNQHKRRHCVQRGSGAFLAAVPLALSVIYDLLK